MTVESRGFYMECIQEIVNGLVDDAVEHSATYEEAKNFVRGRTSFDETGLLVQKIAFGKLDKLAAIQKIEGEVFEKTEEERVAPKNSLPDFSKFSNEELFKCLWNIKVQLPKYTWQDYIENIDKMFSSREVLGKLNVEFEIKMK